jgi:GMP synthase-like glutamine amidotransferase
MLSILATELTGLLHMHIGILVANTDESDFAQRHPKDGDKFRSLLQPLRPDWKFTAIQVKDGVFPETLGDYDGFVITGSPASAAGDDPWILKLLDTIREIDAKKIPTVGICFGHQAIGRALGGEVGKNPGGWGFGISPTHFNTAESWMEPKAETLNLYAAHSEQLLRAPTRAVILGGDDFCAVGSYKIGDHIFTTEYHPEMTPEFIAELVDELGSYVGPAVAPKAKQQVATQKADGKIFAQWMVNFFEMKR